MDPWFSDTGAFFASWFQFPENAHFVEEALNDVTDICISHNHADHFDTETLRRALESNPDLRLHIPKYPTQWFLRRVHHFLPEFCARVFEHEPFQWITIASDVSCYFVPEESPAEFDSAIICKTNNHSLINLNDSRLGFEQLERIRQVTGDVTFLALQGSGASEYPVTYTYPEQDMRTRCIKKRVDKFDHCLRVIDFLQPERLLFFAGPPVFLDDSLRRFNDTTLASVFPDQLDIIRHIARKRPKIAERTLFLLPGEEFDDKFLWSRTDLESKRLAPYTQKKEYIESYREQRKEKCTLDWGDSLEEEILLAYFNKMATLSRRMSEQIGCDVSFIVQGRASAQTFTVDFKAGCARPGLSQNPMYTMTIPASSLKAVLDEEATWDDILLSLRINIDERAPGYVPHLKVLLRYMDREVFHLVEQYEEQFAATDTETPMMEVDLGDEIVLIQRYCPHAGNDLKFNGRINEDGTITCLAHRLCFDIRTGKCIDAQKYQLKVGARNASSTQDSSSEVLSTGSTTELKGTQCE